MAEGVDRWDVFLAHASPDKPRARLLHQALTVLGLRIFLDEESLEPGDDWTVEIPRALRSSDVVAVLLSQERGFYDGEELVISIAGQRTGDQRVVPIHLAPGVEDPYGTARLNRIDWHDEADVDAIVGRLRRVIPRAVRGETAGASTFCHRIPVPPRHLAGRDDLLARLATNLGDGRTTTLTQTIQGMGGVGKTTVAAALCEAQRDHHDIVWWVRAEDEGTLVADLAELAGVVGATTGSGGDADADAIVRWLETTERRWLIVYDNVTDRRSVESRLPRRGSGAAVLTSRDKQMGALGHVEPVDLWRDPIAEAFLRDRVRGRNASAADEELTGVLERTGGLPLALEQAAAWVEQKPNRRFLRWVELYDEAAEKAFPDGTRPVGYEHTAATAWRISIAAAAERSPLAPRLLGAVGHLAPEDIAIQWLRDAAGDPYLDGATPDDVDAAVDALDDYDLVTIRPDDALDVHRIIHDIARRTAPAGADAFAIRALVAQDPVRGTHRDWSLLARLGPHARDIGARTSPSDPSDATRLVLLLARISKVARDEGLLAEGIGTGIVAAEVGHRLVPDTAQSLIADDALAGAYRMAGDFERAIAIYESTLSASEQILGPGHPDTVTSRGNLANAYQGAGDSMRAVELLEATVADHTRINGEDHVNTLTFRNNLATAYTSAGEPEKAIPLLEATLAACIRALGPHDRLTLSCRNNLASTYDRSGDPSRAAALHAAILADRELLFGPHHPDTMTSRNNLAVSLCFAGDLARGIALLELVTEQRASVLGREHPDTLQSQRSLEAARRDA